MGATPAQASTIAATPDAEAPSAEARAPLCFVVDTDASIRHFLSLILHGAGIDTEELPDGQAVRPALTQRQPKLVFLNIALESADAIECILALSRAAYTGAVQLMSNRGSAVLAHVKSIGEQHHLRMLPVLKKPFETSVVLKVLQELRLGDPPAVAGRIDLRDALRNRWIEFWYQPKIDLRKKQLIGVEAFSRARHPQNGVLEPSAFMPGASEGDLVTLSEQALDQALQASLNFCKLGVNLRPAVNIPINALVKVPVADIVESHRGKFEKWPGLIIDVAEEQIVSDLPWPTTSPRSSSTSTSGLRSTISAAAIPRLRGSRNCRSPKSSSTALSSPIAAATRSMRHCARPSSIWRIISAASRSRSASRRRPTRWRWSAWAAITARAFCSASRCPRSASFRCLRSAPIRRRDRAQAKHRPCRRRLSRRAAQCVQGLRRP